MEWLFDLFIQNSIAHTILIYALVIAFGLLLGKIKVAGVSLGVTLVLFVALAAGHYMRGFDDNVLDLFKNFGLILFIFSVGLQVGPGFFSSFKKGGVLLNLLSLAIILVGVGTTILLFKIANHGSSFPMFVGLMSGAVTSTPGLGAAQEALSQIGASDPISLGYAVTYPIGVLGTILTMMLIKLLFRVDVKQEEERLRMQNNSLEKPCMITLRVTNPHLEGVSIINMRKQCSVPFIISRVMHDGKLVIPQGNTELHRGDIIFGLAQSVDMDAFKTFIGEETEMEWKDDDAVLVSRRIVVTKNSINGRTLGSLNLRSAYGVNVTRVSRAGVNLLANPDLILQVGDRVMVVGPLDAIAKAEKMLGNTMKKLNEPHLVTIFLGIAMGILLGSFPIYVPSMPMPVKLGIAGGPLIVAILIGRFGYKLHLISYTTQSANLMLREIGICLFLTSVGLSAGDSFVETVFSAEGLRWLLCGCIITILPPLLIGTIAMLCKVNYLSVCGLIAGSHTNAPPLAYASSLSESDVPAVAYSTVYPFATFLRIVAAQTLILTLA